MNSPQKTNEIPIQIEGCELSRTGLKIADSVGVATWKQIGHLLCRGQDSIQWWIGDWINHGESKFGDKYKEALNIFGEESSGYGYTPGQLRMYSSAAGRVAKRFATVSWYHHFLVAPMGQEDQVKWLGLAAENKWSTRQLKDAIKAELSDPDAGETHKVDKFSWLTWVTQGERWLKFEIEEIAKWKTERVEAVKRDLDRIIPLKQIVDDEYERRAREKPLIDEAKERGLAV